jgi:hypothetical protein
MGVLEMIRTRKGSTQGGEMLVSAVRDTHSRHRRRALAGILAAITFPLGCPLSHAAYPERVITLIVPFPAGGPTDIIARIVSVGLQKSLGQSVIVDNRGGGRQSRHGHRGARTARRLHATAHLDRHCC